MGGGGRGVCVRGGGLAPAPAPTAAAPAMAPRPAYTAYFCRHHYLPACLPACHTLPSPLLLTSCRCHCCRCHLCSLPFAPPPPGLARCLKKVVFVLDELQQYARKSGKQQVPHVRTRTSMRVRARTHFHKQTNTRARTQACTLGHRRSRLHACRGGPGGRQQVLGVCSSPSLPPPPPPAPCAP